MSTPSLWVVVQVGEWNSSEAPGYMGVGWMPVFTSEEDAERHYPGAQRIGIIVNHDNDLTLSPNSDGIAFEGAE